MYRENFVDSLHSEIVEMVTDYLTPVALKYGYSEVPLETTIKWRPLVLFLGNYSSGKSTLINELLDGDIQTTGQAPTDDSFTVISFDDSANDGNVRIIEERDGKYLLNNPDFPFDVLKKYGQRFSSHFCYKKVNSPFLKDVAIIDTPGMHDSVAQRDRGYDYQQVVGDLAEIADLVLILFDPHKAGTIREAYTSIRETLPKSTFEDRIMFVLNRIDECVSLTDLLRVYGTLCWNLSQITGRKDIPAIHLTYSIRAAMSSENAASHDKGYIKHLDNQRDDLVKAIHEVPNRRLDNMASFVETHSERLSHFLEAMINYKKRIRTYSLKIAMLGCFVSFLCGGGAAFAMAKSDLFADSAGFLKIGLGGGFGIAVFALWLAFAMNAFSSALHRRLLENVDTLTPLLNQTRKDSWEAIKDITVAYLQNTGGRFALKKVRQEYAEVTRVFRKGARDIREALNELAGVEPDQFVDTAGKSGEKKENRPSFRF